MCDHDLKTPNNSTDVEATKTNADVSIIPLLGEEYLKVHHLSERKKFRGHERTLKV